MAEKKRSEKEILDYIKWRALFDTGIEAGVPTIKNLASLKGISEREIAAGFKQHKLDYERAYINRHKKDVSPKEQLRIRREIERTQREAKLHPEKFRPARAEPGSRKKESKMKPSEKTLEIRTRRFLGPGGVKESVNNLVAGAILSDEIAVLLGEELCGPNNA